MEFVIFPALLLLMYLLVLRPQQQRLRQHSKLVDSLAVGEDIISSAGIFGRIVGLDDEVAVLEVADGVQIKVARQAIARRVSADQPGGSDEQDERDGEDDS